NAARIRGGDRRLERRAKRLDRRDRVLRQPARRGGRQAHRRGEVVPPAGGRGAASPAAGGRLMRASRRAVGPTLLGCFVAVAPLPGQQTPAGLLRFLRQSIGLDSAQLAAVERGTAVVKVLDTKNQRDVAVFGIITADVPRQRYVARLQDFQS